MYQGIPIVYFLQVCGILSHPYVTLVYLLEQITIHVLGSSPRASDSRVFLYFIFNTVFALIPVFIEADRKVRATLTVVLSFIASHNFLLTLGIKKPFDKENTNLKAQNDYASIVFKSKASVEENTASQRKRLMANAAVSAVMGVVLVVIALTAGNVTSINVI